MTVQPILSGFYPDPSICRVGNTYYLISSSFEYLPGIPIHTSTDLITWDIVGNALTRPSQIAENGGFPSSGIFAPTIRHHDGRFWIIGTNVNDIPEGSGHFLIWAEDPSGPWSDPVHIPGTIGIDPDIVWDDEGTAHVTWCSLVPGQPSILSAPIDTATGAMLAEPRALWQGTGLAAPEGPHLYRIEGWWYLLLAEGGTERGHTATIARSRTINGSYEAAPHNPFLTHRSLAHVVQNVGHADLIQLADDSWAAVHLGVRTRGQSPGFHVNGRETFLVGIDWVDGWPVVDEERFAVAPVDGSFVDRFTTDTLHPRWLGVGRFPSSFTRAGVYGGLLIDAADGGDHALLVARSADLVWTATSTFTPIDGTSRFLVRIDDRHCYALSYDGATVTAAATIGDFEHTIGHWPVPSGVEPTLVIRVKPPRPLPYGVAQEPDLIELAVRAGDDEYSFGEFDGRYLSTEVAGGFTGRVFGVEPLTGSVHVHDITYAAAPEPAAS